jgi:hypothetical protein
MLVRLLPDRDYLHISSSSYLWTSHQLLLRAKYRVYSGDLLYLSTVQVFRVRLCPYIVLLFYLFLFIEYLHSGHKKYGLGSNGRSHLT